MLKTVAASSAAKALALCVCPVLGGAALLKVPAVRQKVHEATAPKSAQPKRSRLVKRGAPAPVCPDPVPVNFVSAPLTPLSLEQPDGLTVLNTLDDPEAATTVFASALEDPRHRPGESARIFGGAGVPEPAVWLQTIIGLGVAGATLRMSTRNRASSALDKDSAPVTG